MLASFLIGLVAGQRAMTPLAVLSGAARRGQLPPGTTAARFLAHPVVALGTVALAAGEMAGDKMPSAPDRTVPVGLLARSLTAGFAGAVLAPRDRRATGAALAVAAAVGASFVGLALRRQAMNRYGQAATGFVEDGIVLAVGQAIASQGRRSMRRNRR